MRKLLKQTESKTKVVFISEIVYGGLQILNIAKIHVKKKSKTSLIHIA